MSRRRIRPSRPSARCRTSGSTAAPSSPSATASISGWSSSAIVARVRRGSTSATAPRSAASTRRDGDETWTVVWNGGIYMLHGAEDTGPPRRHEIDLDGTARASAGTGRRRARRRVRPTYAGPRSSARAAILASSGTARRSRTSPGRISCFPTGRRPPPRRLIAAACATWPETGGAPRSGRRPGPRRGCRRGGAAGDRSLGELGASRRAGRVAG